MNRFVTALCITLAVTFAGSLAVGGNPVAAMETEIQKGPRDGSFSVTFDLADIPGQQPGNLTVKAIGSETFGVSAAMFRNATISTMAEERTCFAHIRVLQGAVEMYNMDNMDKSGPIRTFDERTRDRLVEGGYLKSTTMPQPQCSYGSDGDLMADGAIACNLHGKIPTAPVDEQIRSEARAKALNAPQRLRVTGRFRGDRPVTFALTDRQTGALVKTVELPVPTGRPTTAALGKSWSHQMSSRLAVLRAMTPLDPGLAYLEKQLPRVFTPQRSTPAAPSSPRWDRPSAQARPDLYSLTTGGLAVQESLQLDRMTNPSESDGPASIPIERLTGPGIKSHPFAEMIGNRTPAVFPIDALVPETFYSCHFSDINRQLAFGDFIDRWGSNLLHSFEVSAHDSKLKEKLLGQLCLEASELTRLFGDKVIADLTICGSDPFVQEGTDVSVIFSLKNRALFDLNIARLLARAKAEVPGCIEQTVSVRDVPVRAVTSPDLRVRSYSCDHGEYKIFSNSLGALTHILMAAQKVVPALSNADDYRYMRTIFPADVTKEDGFLYLSDPHIRQLVSPVWKIARQRRLQCQSSLHILQSAVTLFHLLKLDGPITLENLYKERVLEKGYLRCPDGGTYSWDEGNGGPAAGEAVCSVHGRLRHLTPILDCKPQRITSREKSEYEAFVTSYNQYWRQFFDPIGIRATLTPERLHAETCILPLVETTIYNGFKRLSGGDPVKIDLPDHPRAIMQLIGKLDFGNVASWNAQSTDLAARLVSGSDLTLDHLLQAVGRSFVLGLVDSSMKFEFDGGILSDFMPGMGRDTIQVLTLSYLMASLNLPVYALIEIRDAALTEQFLRGWLTRSALDNAMSRGSSRREFFEFKFCETTSGPGKRPVFTLDMLVLVIRWRIFFTVRDDCLVITSQRRLLEELSAPDAPRLTTETNVETRINYRAFNEISDTTRLRWQERIRDACLGGLGSLYALSSFRGLPPADWSKGALLINGAIPYCPLGGVATFDPNADAVVCSIHGDPLHPRQPLTADPNAPLNKLLDALKGMSASLRFTPEGIMTAIDLTFTK